MENENIKTPKWFWAVSIFFILWNLMGVFSFYAPTFISNEAIAKLPTNEREVYGHYPLSTTIEFAIAASVGMIGTIGLVLKKNGRKQLF